MNHLFKQKPVPVPVSRTTLYQSLHDNISRIFFSTRTTSRHRLFRAIALGAFVGSKKCSAPWCIFRCRRAQPRITAFRGDLCSCIPCVSALSMILRGSCCTGSIIYYCTDKTDLLFYCSVSSRWTAPRFYRATLKQDALLYVALQVIVRQ